MKKTIVVVVLAIVMLAGLALQAYFIHALRGDLNREKTLHQQNLSALMEDIERYKLNDSVSVAKVGALTLTLGDYERLRQKDMETIRKLRTAKNDLEGVVKAQSTTIVELTTEVQKVTQRADSTQIESILFNHRDKWCNVDGKIEGDSLHCKIAVRDSLMIVRSVKYSKCLVKKWRKVRGVEYEIVNFNPNTHIDGFSVVEIEKKQ